jgi:hypothetical protein
MGKKSFGTKGSTKKEEKNKAELFSLIRNSPIPDGEFLKNIGLYINRQTLTRIIYMYEIYKKTENVKGSVFDFGTRWGQNMALFVNLRGMIDPYSHHKKVVGFDTFSGFPESSVGKNDQSAEIDDLATTSKYESHLSEVLERHEKESPIDHKKKFQIVKGDVLNTLPKYLEKNPQTVISLAYFDLDLYKPTKNCLEIVKNRMPKGGIIALDDMNVERWPGETKAIQKVFGIRNIKLKTSNMVSRMSYFVID